MGSFKTLAQRRASDTAVLSAKDRPEDVKPEHWLQDGETITYWKSLPHGAIQDIVAAASNITLDAPEVQRWDASLALQARLEVGIVDWTIKDGDGLPVEWRHEKARELLDGIPYAVFNSLQGLIGSGEVKVTEEKVEAEVVGEAQPEL
jgi:hypothetical protein